MNSYVYPGGSSFPNGRLNRPRLSERLSRIAKYLKGAIRCFESGLDKGRFMLDWEMNATHNDAAIKME